MFTYTNRCTSSLLCRGVVLAHNRPGEALFPVSGNSCRRHCPSHSGTIRASPSPLSPPGAFSSSREPFPLLDFDREPLQPQKHFGPEASSAAKLTIGDSLLPRRPNDHRENRPSLADPSRLSGARGEQPFAGVDRRRPASVRPKEEEGGMDWSNLTSGPPGPTISDPALVHVG